MKRAYLNGFKTIKKLRKTRSKLLKKKILKEEWTEELGYIIKFNIDQSFTTGLSEKKINKVVTNKKTLKEFETAVKAETIDEIMYYLRMNPTGKDMQILMAQHYLGTLYGWVKELAKTLLIKDMKMEMGRKEVNQVKPGFINITKPMLAYSIDKGVDLLEDEETVYLTEKLDGNRNLIEKASNDDITMYSREGLVLDIDSFIEIKEELKSLPNGFIYDGEMIALEGATAVEQFQNTNKIIRVKGDKKGLVYKIFDMIPISEFRNGKSKEDYTARRVRLNELLDDIQDLKFVEVVEVLMEGKYTSAFNDKFKELISEGKEGAMINLGSEPYYVDARKKAILKMKEFFDSDLKIIKFVEGKGRNKNTLGKVIVEYKGEEVGVGSGFDDKERRELWDNQDEYLGTIIQVKHLGESKDKTGKLSLRCPVFERFRDDKDEPNY